jgi:hypothetical protein
MRISSPTSNGKVVSSTRTLLAHIHTDATRRISRLASKTLKQTVTGNERTIMPFNNTSACFSESRRGEIESWSGDEDEDVS